MQIIYDPHRQDNEELSADFFKVNMEKLLNIDDQITLVTKVVDYVLATKAHNVLQSYDEDLRLFIDFDMSILGRDRLTYTKYAQNIRREYIHISLSDYCRGRSAFLRKFLDETVSIYATQQFRGSHEQRARDNITWECDILDNGRIPGFDKDVTMSRSPLSWQLSWMVIPMAAAALATCFAVAPRFIAQLTSKHSHR